MSNFLSTISRLRWIQRWSLKRNTMPENVMEHSWETGVIAHLLGVINNHVYGGSLNPYRLATLAIYHDCAESITGDLPTPVKYYSTEIQQAYRVIEEDAQKALLAMLPAEMQLPMSEVLDEQQLGLEERKYVKAADSLSAYLKAQGELANGNAEYQHTVADLQQRLNAYDLAEVTYFLEHFAESGVQSEWAATVNRPKKPVGAKKCTNFMSGSGSLKLFA